MLDGINRFEILYREIDIIQNYIKTLSRVNIPRFSGVSNDSISYLVGFLDSSEKSMKLYYNYFVPYASNGRETVRLFYEKSTVAPMKTL